MIPQQNYSQVFSQETRDQIRHLHPELKSIIRARLKELSKNPLIGKNLEKELSGYWSLRANRYRIIYKTKEADREIEIHYVGHRRDIYELFRDQVAGIANGDSL